MNKKHCKSNFIVNSTKKFIDFSGKKIAKISISQNWKNKIKSPLVFFSSSFQGIWQFLV
jgi:hypothetical protein